MKDMGTRKHILGMDIMRNRENENLWLRQRKYVNYMLQHFHMLYCKPLSVPIFVGTNLLVEQCPTTSLEMEDINSIPYTSVGYSLMYAIVCTRLYIAKEEGVLSQFMANLRCEHWDIVKRVFRYLWGTSEYSIFYHNYVLRD